MRNKLEQFLEQISDNVALNSRKAFLKNRDLLTTPVDNSSAALCILHIAAQRRDLDIIKLILERYPDLLNQTDKFNQTPLLWAARRGHNNIVEYLISLGADLNVTTNCEDEPIEHGRTALHWAVVNFHLPIVKLLIQAGATIDKLTLQHPRFRAYLYYDKDLDVARAIVNDRELLTTPIDSSGGPCILHKAAEHGYLAIVKLILQKNPDLLNQTDKFNQTPLIWAASCGHNDIVEYLISSGADLNVTTNCENEALEHGRTALDWAEAGDHSEISVMLQVASNVRARENRAENLQTSVPRVSFLRAKKLNISPEDFTWVNKFECH